MIVPTVPPEALAILHCDSCRLRYARPLVPLGRAVAACAFWIEEGHMHDDPFSPAVKNVAVPCGAPIEVIEHHLLPIAGEYVQTEGGEVLVIVMPYIIQLLDGPYAGVASCAYWCEVS